MVVYVTPFFYCGKNNYVSNYSGSACIALCTPHLRCLRSLLPMNSHTFPMGSLTNEYQTSKQGVFHVMGAAQVMREQPILMAHSVEHVSLLRRATGLSIVRLTSIHTSSHDARLSIEAHRVVIRSLQASVVTRSCRLLSVHIEKNTSNNKKRGPGGF